MCLRMQFCRFLVIYQIPLFNARSEHYAEYKGKERKIRVSIYIAPFILRIVSERSGMDHTVYLQISPCLP